MANKLRILYNNVAKVATSLTASSSASSSTVISNVLNDTKTSIWRSSTGSTHTVSVAWATASSQLVNAVIMPFCNFKSTVKARFKFYSDTAYNTVIYDTTTAVSIVKGSGLGMWNWSENTLGVNNFSFGTTPYATFYTNTVYSIGSMQIIIEDATQNLFEIGMLVIGQYREPWVNFDTNPEFGLVDTTKQERTEAGNLIVTRGTISKTISMTLSYIEGIGSGLDKNMLLGIQASNGMQKPAFYSLFPDDADTDKEQMYQIYGYMKQLSPFGQAYNNIYNTSIDIVEV